MVVNTSLKLTNLIQKANISTKKNKHKILINTFFSKRWIEHVIAQINNNSIITNKPNKPYDGLLITHRINEKIINNKIRIMAHFQSNFFGKSNKSLELKFLSIINKRFISSGVPLTLPIFI